MSRRKFLQRVAMGVSAFLVAPVSLANGFRVCGPLKPCRVIGIGGAGINSLIAMLRTKETVSIGGSVDYVALDRDAGKLRTASPTMSELPAVAPFRAVFLEAVSSNGSETSVTELVETSDRLILIAGLGGVTGSDIALTMARRAREFGVPSAAVVITPLSFEGLRAQRADTVISDLRHQLDSVTVISNESTWNRLGSDATLNDVFAAIDNDVMTSVRALLA